MRFLTNTVDKWNHIKIRFFLLSLITGALPFFLLPVYFMEPDDYLLNYIANGSYGFEGSQNLVFIKLPIGCLLKLLYRLTTQVNWYAILLAAFIILSYTVIYDCIWACTKSHLGILAVFLSNLVVLTWFFTFTVAGYLTVLAGGVLVCTAIIREKPMGCRIAGVLLIYLGYCMRKDTVLSTLFLLIPLGLRCLYRTYGISELKKQILLFLKSWGMPIVLALILLGGTHVLDRAAYQGEQWDGFLEFTSARGYAVDYPSLTYAYHIGEFQEVGIDEIDYYMLVGWNFAEKQVFTPDKMSGAGRVEARNISLRSRTDYAIGQLNRKGILLILLPFFTWLFLLLSRKKYPWFFGLITVGCVWMLDLILLIIRLRYVDRVVFPMMIASVTALILLGTGTEKKSPIASTTALVILLALPGCLYMKDFSSSVAWMKQPYDSPYHASLVKEIHDHPENLYVFDVVLLSGMYYYNHPVSKVLTTDTFQNVARAGSWDTFSLRYYNQVQNYVDDPDNLLSALILEKNVKYVSYDASVPKLKSFLEYHSGKTCNMSETSFEDSRYKIYSFELNES